MGYHLAEQGLRFVIADANPEVGHMWRSRWQSLKLFTAGQYNDLPGMPFPAEPDTYPGKDAVADFLAAYVAEFSSRCACARPDRLSLGDHGRYLAETTTGAIKADQVVIATGPFQVPFTPPVADQLDPELRQLHSAAYRRPEDLPAAASWWSARPTPASRSLSSGGEPRGRDLRRPETPDAARRPLGRDIWWWLTATRLAKVPVSSWLGQRLSQRDVVIGGGLRELRANGVAVRPRVTAGSGRSIHFEGGESADYDGVVWATRFRVDHSWVDIPVVKDERGQVRHARGVTDSPGLYLLGMTWQHTRTSALLGWVGADAAYLATRIESNNQNRVGVGEPRPPPLRKRRNSDAHPSRNQLQHRRRGLGGGQGAGGRPPRPRRQARDHHQAGPQDDRRG